MAWLPLILMLTAVSLSTRLKPAVALEATRS